MLLRVLLGVVAVVLCTYIGYKLSCKYKNKRLFYTDFCSFNKMMKTEVVFKQNSINDIISKSGKEGDYFKELKNYYFDKEHFELKENYLKKEEKDFVIDYLSSLGDGDADSQVKYLESVQKQIEDNLYSAKEEEKKYRTLYVKLGFLIGLIILVVLL